MKTVDTSAERRKCWKCGDPIEPEVEKITPEDVPAECAYCIFLETDYFPYGCTPAGVIEYLEAEHPDWLETPP